MYLSFMTEQGMREIFTVKKSNLAQSLQYLYTRMNGRKVSMYIFYAIAAGLLLSTSGCYAGIAVAEPTYVVHDSHVYHEGVYFVWEWDAYRNRYMKRYRYHAPRRYYQKRYYHKKYLKRYRAPRRNKLYKYKKRYKGR